MHWYHIDKKYFGTTKNSLGLDKWNVYFEIESEKPEKPLNLSLPGKVFFLAFFVLECILESQSYFLSMLLTKVGRVAAFAAFLILLWERAF